MSDTMNLTEISRGLKLSNDGIWRSVDTEFISYPRDGNEACFALEDESFWFLHRNQCIVSAIRHLPPTDGGAIFDIGGGNGFVARAIQTAGYQVVLVEPGHDGARNAKHRGLQTVICSTLRSARFISQSLPAIGLFDVLEHIERDREFLAELRDLLIDSGRLYLTVPAYQFLWSHSDATAGHYRRYRLSQLQELLGNVGFEVKFSSYFFQPLVLPIFLGRTVPSFLRRLPKGPSKRRSKKEHNAGGDSSRQLLAKILSAEPTRIAKGKPMSFGASCLVVATRTG